MIKRYCDACGEPMRTDKAIAQVALTELLERVLATERTTEPDAASMASKLIEAASRVGFQPSNRRLVIGFDLGMSQEDDS